MNRLSNSRQNGMLRSKGSVRARSARRRGSVIPALLRGALALPLLSALPASAECTAPQRPALPDGAESTREEMLAGLEAVKAFQKDNMTYMQCLEKLFPGAPGGAGAPAEANYMSLSGAGPNSAMDAYNAAVSAEEEVAGSFNTELREYRAAQQ